MPTQVPCPNPNCEDGVIVFETEDDHPSPNSRCDTCAGTGWVIPKEGEETEDNS